MGWSCSKSLVLAALLALPASACAPSHAGRTVGRGVLQLEGGLGGPFVTNFGGAIPAPNLPLGLRYGVTDRLDVQGHLNLLPLVLGGFLTMDAGVTWALVRHEGRDGWNLATSASLALLTDFQSAGRLAPVVDLAGGYTVRSFTVYAGAELWVDLWGGRVATNPYLGVELDLRRTTLSAAAVWFHPALDVAASAADYVSAGDQGGVGLILGVKHRLRHRFGGDRRRGRRHE